MDGQEPFRNQVVKPDSRLAFAVCGYDVAQQVPLVLRVPHLEVVETALGLIADGCVICKRGGRAASARRIRTEKAEVRFRIRREVCARNVSGAVSVDRAGQRPFFAHLVDALLIRVFRRTCKKHIRHTACQRITRICVFGLIVESRFAARNAEGIHAIGRRAPRAVEELR